MPKQQIALFKYTWSILQDRLHARPQKSLNKFNKTKIISTIFSNFWYDTRNQLLKKNCEKQTRV